MSYVEALRQEVRDANVFALLSATDTARLMIAQAVWAKPSDLPSTAVWASRPEASEARR